MIIAHISDFHSTKKMYTIKRMLNVLYKEKPDIVVITGDLYDERRSNRKGVNYFIEHIEKDTPVISIITDNDILDKTISNVKGVKARGAYVLIVSSINLDKYDDLYDDVIYVDKTNDLVEPILAILPLQLLAYNIALLRGCDIDKPRNLAKSVTVE